MTRLEFREKLALRLSAIPLAERTKSLDFYDEMVSDRIEEGMSEEDAVAALGSIDKISAEILYSISNSQTPAEAAVISAERQPKKHTGLIIALLVIGSPLWISLAAALLSVIVAVFAVLWSIVIAVAAVLLSAAAVGTVGLGYGIFVLCTASPSIALFMIGISLIAAALTLACIPLVVLCFTCTVKLTAAIAGFIKRKFVH